MKKLRKTIAFPVLIEQDEYGYYVGTVPGLRSCYTQAKTLSKLYERLQEAVDLSLEVEEKLFKKIPTRNRFIGIQQMDFAY